MFTVKDIIDMAIQLERNGENICRQAAKKTKAPPLAALFEWMAEEELKHEKWLAELKKTAALDSTETPMEAIGKDLLRSVLGAQGFSLGDADLTKVEQVRELLTLLIEFENDTILFYEMVRSIVEAPTVLKYLDMIIAEEQQHVNKLRAYSEQVISGSETIET